MRFPPLSIWLLVAAMAACASTFSATPLDCALALGARYSPRGIMVTALEELARPPEELVDAGWRHWRETQEANWIFPLSAREGYRGMVLSPEQLRYRIWRGLETDHRAPGEEANRVRFARTLAVAGADSFGINAPLVFHGKALAVIAVISCDRVQCQPLPGDRTFYVEGDVKPSAVLRYLVFDPVADKFREVIFYEP